MTDSNTTKKDNFKALYQRKILETSDKAKVKEDKLESDGESAFSYNCKEDYNDIIAPNIIKRCDVENLKSTNTGSTLLLDNQLEKIHIDSKCASWTYPFKHNCGGKLKLQDNGYQACYNDDDKKVKKYEPANIKVSSLIKESEAPETQEIQTLKSLPPIIYSSSSSGNDLPKVLRSGGQKKIYSPSKSIYTNCSKANLPTLLKSQSLDLCNEDSLAYNNDQYFHCLPDITECRTFESKNQSIRSNTQKSEHGQGEYRNGSTGEIRQHLTHRPNIPSTLFQSAESRPIYPNVPYSPYGSPYGSPRSKRRPPLRESCRISIEKSGSFLQLNQYKLMDQIGQGSYGLVKLAYSEEDSTHYAMKILSKKRLLRQAAFMRRGPKQTTSPLDRVYREIAVLKKLDHPNVVKLVEVLDDPIEDSLYMVFELVKNGEVLSIPTNKPLTEERAWNVFRDCLLGLEYLHYQKIIHADLKPGNLLLTECGHVKIADLGVCNEFLGEDATMNNGSTGGTPAFRAPETLNLGKNVYCGRAADIWALGATLYSMVYGNVPFMATSVPLLYDKVRNEAVFFPETPILSSDLQYCIVQMLEKDPSKRITLPQLKINPWVTRNGTYCLPTEDENCCLVQVDDEDINSVVRSIPKLDTLILIKTMLKNHSFGNPFMKSVSGRAPQPGGSRLEKFVQAGRSNSAPGSYHIPLDRESSTENVLPALTEHISSHIKEEL